MVDFGVSRGQIWAQASGVKTPWISLSKMVRHSDPSLIVHPQKNVLDKYLKCKCDPFRLLADICDIGRIASQSKI